MKKYLSLILLIAIFSVIPANSQEVSSVVDPEDTLFQSSVVNFANELDNMVEEYSDDRYYQDIDPNNMPFFKQMRLRLSNRYVLSQAKAQEQKEKRSFKFWGKKSQQPLEKLEDSETEDMSSSELQNSIDEFVNNEDSDTLALEGGINTETTEKQLMLDAENINFDEDTGDMIATGRPVLYLPPQNTKVIADKMTYNEDGNILKAIGNVIVNKDGKPLYTDYLEINMNEETLDMDKMKAQFPLLELNAEHATQQDGLLILTKGNLHSDKSSVTQLTSRFVGPGFTDMILNPEDEVLFFGHPERNKLDIRVKDIVVEARKNHDVIKAKKIQFAHNGRVFFKWPSLTVYTNKQHNYFEGNYPEFGSRRKLGAFFGPGLAFSGPFGSVMKVIPFINYRSGFGIGGMLKYVNSYNRTELGYGSANSIFFLRGKQKLDDDLYLQYAYNSFTNEWFLGGRMPKYMAELVYDKGFYHRDFLGKGMDMTFRHRGSFGFMKDDDKSYNGEHYNDATNMSTTRTRYMAEINQTLFSYVNKEKRAKITFGTLLQGSAAVYGTGDTQFIARVGPDLRIQYKNWMQSVSYFLTGYNDQTPLPHFDAYRYGRSSVRVTEALRINKYLTVGWAGYINLSDDAPNGKMFQENAFLVGIGPEDLKIVLGYDFIRDRTYFGFNIAFDPKGTDVIYDKMVIKNPEKLGKSSDDNEHKIAFSSSQKQQPQKQQKNLASFRKPVATGPVVLEYAQVIELEDPDKERIE